MPVISISDYSVFMIVVGMVASVAIMALSMIAISKNTFKNSK